MSRYYCHNCGCVSDPGQLCGVCGVSCTPENANSSDRDHVDQLLRRAFDAESDQAECRRVYNKLIRQRSEAIVERDHDRWTLWFINESLCDCECCTDLEDRLLRARAPWLYKESAQRGSDART